MSDPVAVEAAALSRRWAGMCLALLASLVFWGFLPFTPLAVTLALLVAGLALLRARLLHAAAHFERNGV